MLHEERMQEADQIIFLSIFHHGLVSFEPSNGISLTEARSEKVWQQAVLNALTGILSDGFSGMGGQKNAKERYQRVQENYPEKVIVLRSQKGDGVLFRKSSA